MVVSIRMLLAHLPPVSFSSSPASHFQSPPLALSPPPILLPTTLSVARLLLPWSPAIRLGPPWRLFRPRSPRWASWTTPLGVNDVTLLAVGDPRSLRAAALTCTALAAATQRTAPLWWSLLATSEDFNPLPAAATGWEADFVCY